MEEFNIWLEAKLKDYGWQPSDLAREDKMGNSTVTRVLNGTRKPGVEFCLTVAKVFREPEEKVLRLAGILPPLSDLLNDKTITELVEIIKHLSEEQRQDVLEYASWRFQQQEQRKHNKQNDKNQTGSKILGTKVSDRAN